MANPDFAFNEGFDHYTESGDDTLDISSLLARRWTNGSNAGQNVFIAAALSGSTGYALRVNSGVAGNALCGPLKTLPGNYARMIGGFTIKPWNLFASVSHGIQFLDSGSVQFGIGINNLGQIEARRGDMRTGTLIATSTETIAQATVHVIEFDITFHNSTGIIKVYLDGAICANLNLTGQDTCNTANNYTNGFVLGHQSGNNTNKNTDFDHCYFWCYTASGGSETPLLYGPVIETQFGNGDDTAQFTVGPSVVGKDYRTTTATNAPGANFLALVPVTPEVNMTLNSVSIVPAATSATAKLKAVLYADSSGAPGSLVATGTEVVGTVNGTALNLPFGSGQSLTGGTQYWIGYITDTSVAIREYSSTLNNGRKIANTYTSGAPNPAGAMTTGQVAWQIWGNCTGAAANYSQVNKNEATLNEYNSELTVGDKDLFNFPSLAITPSAVSMMTVIATGAKTDGGARTVDVLAKSGATQSSGSAGTLNPAVSLTCLDTNFFVDPDTGVAWTASGVNGSKEGYKIAA